MKDKKSNNLYRKARPGREAKAVSRSELAKDGGAKKRKKLKPNKLRGCEILQFTIEGKFIREYSSMIEAANDLGINHIAIYRCLKGLQKTGGYFQWRYKIDPNFDEGIFDIPPAITNYNYKLQPVVQYTLEGKFVKEYTSIKEAAEIFAVPVISISKCVRREKKSVKGYQWRLKKDVIKDGKIIDIDPDPNRLLRPVCQFGRDGKFLREYSSRFEAGKDLGIDHMAIYRCLKGFQKTAGDFQWRYKKDPIFDEGIVDIPPVITTYPSPYNLQPVVQYTLEGKFVKEHTSIKDAAEIFAVFPILIKLCIKGEKKNTKGYQWRLKKDVIKDGKIMDIGPVKKPPGQAVCKFDRDGKFIREYPSMSEAARDEHVSKGAISSRLKRKKCEDYQWRIKAEVVKDGKIIDIGPLKKTGSKKNFMSKYSYPVCQFGKNKTFIREYPSPLEAAKETNLPRHTIFSCAVKKIKDPGGFHWRFREEVVNKNGKIIDLRFKEKEIKGKKHTKNKANKSVRRSHYYYFREICQFEKDGKFIREYPSIQDAADEVEISDVYIFWCVQKKQKTAAGFQWRLKEEVVNKDGKIKDIEPVQPVRPHFLRAVCQFKQDGTLVREYPSIYKASEITDISRCVIFANASRKAKNRHGYLWRFKEDVVDKDGKISDIDTRKPISERFLRPVYQFERDGKFLREYPTILDAAQKTSSNKEYIYICAQRKIKSTAGFQWRYKNDPEFKNGIADIAPYEIKEPGRKKKA